jgi:hypothetical protein
MRAAADREDASEKHVVVPGPMIPARELLGDLLMDLGKPADALAQYEASIGKEPNRFRGLYGAALAAERSGDMQAGSGALREARLGHRGVERRRPELASPARASREELRHPPAPCGRPRGRPALG